MATLFEKIKECEEAIGDASFYRMILNPGWICDLRISTEVMWHRDHGDVYALEAKLSRRTSSYYPLVRTITYSNTVDRDRMQRLSGLREWEDPSGSELVLQSPSGRKGYMSLLPSDDPPQDVVNVLEGMGHKLRSYGGERSGSYCYLHCGLIWISPDPSIYPVWKPFEDRDKNLCYHGSEEARRRLDEQRRSLEVYDTLLRTCYS